MLYLVLLFLFLLFPRPTQAKAPLLHQLFQSYRPQKISTLPPIINYPQVLGVSTNQPQPSPTLNPPVAIGGEGRMVTIALLGDSMIQTLPSATLEKSLNLYFPTTKFNILNFGRGATTIEQGASLLPQILKQQPDFVVIESFAYNNFGNTQAGYDRQWLALGSITSQIKTQLPQTKIILAAAIAPNSVSFANGSQYKFSALEKIEKTDTIKLYLQNLVNFATSQNFPLANAYQLSLKNNQVMSSLVSPTDNLHPSDLGHQLLSDLIADTIHQNDLL